MVLHLADKTSSARRMSEEEAALKQADDLRGWMAGEATLLAWLEDDPSSRPSLFSAVGPDQELEDELSAMLRDREEEIEQLRQKLESLDEANAASLEELARLKVEIDRLTKSNIDLMSVASSAGIAEKEAALKELEASLEGREAALEARESKGRKLADAQEMEKRLHAELAEKEAEHKRLEADLTEKVRSLEEGLRNKTLELRMLEDKLKAKGGTDEAERKDLQEKLRAAQEKETMLAEMRSNINRMEDQLKERDDELREIKEIVGYKERELARREEEIQFRERKITEEQRKIEEIRRATGGEEEVSLKKRLEDLREEVGRREKELQAKEEFVRSKEAELRQREQGIIEADLKQKEEEIAIESSTQKVKTGNPRFDDLLLGGIPFGSNVLVYGPPFVGKETMMDQFVAEGLKKGIPTIWVNTDKVPADLREEMKLVLPQYEEYEALGLVRYVDVYSRSIGDMTEDKYATYVDHPSDHNAIGQQVDEAAKAFKEKYEYYRVAFRTVSTLIAYSDPTAAFRFLTPFCGKRKRDRAVTMYSIDKGMHNDQEIQMLGSIMDGMVDFKVEQLKTFFMVKGITDVQSRSYIKYTANRHGLAIGSFALDHIK